MSAGYKVLADVQTTNMINCEKAISFFGVENAALENESLDAFAIQAINANVST